MTNPLTRKDQVLEVMKADGWVVTEPRECGFGIARLYDRDGNHVPAWQTAITSNLKPLRCRVEIDGPVRVWRLKGE